MNTAMLSHMQASCKLIEQSFGLDEINERLHDRDEAEDSPIQNLIADVRNVVDVYEKGGDLEKAIYQMYSTSFEC